MRYEEDLVAQKRLEGVEAKMELVLTEEAAQEPSIFNCSVCQQPLFTSHNVVSAIEDGILIRNKPALAQCSNDWDYKQKGTVTCPKKGCLLKLGSYNKRGVKIGNESIVPAIYINMRQVKRNPTTEEVLNKYQEQVSFGLF